MGYRVNAGLRPLFTLAALAALFLGIGGAQAEENRDCEECPIMVTMPEGPDFGKFTVTRREFEAFAKDTGLKEEKLCFRWREQRPYRDDNAAWRKPGFEQGADHPVVCVTWVEATAYADWLSEKTGKSYRLPTLEESQSAAAANADTRFWWGDNPDDICQYANVGDRTFKANFPSVERNFDCEDGFVFTAPVGSFKPNSYGLHDMNGNVWQWTNSCLKGDCANAIFRGAAWNDIWPKQVELTHSFGDRIQLRGASVGFRVVRDK